jgi:hypothetical protein
MSGRSRFDLFITDLFGLYLGLERELQTNRLHVAASCRRALAALRAYPPDDDGETILLETAIEQFEELLRRAGGRP